VSDDGRFLALTDRLSPDPRVWYCAIAGAKHRPPALQDERFRPLSEVLLRPEPENPHDPDAVGVWDQAGTLQVGYVPANLSGDIASQLRAGEPLGGLILREIRRGSATGSRVALHLLLAPLGTLDLQIASD
jgi:hypothetical protein